MKKASESLVLKIETTASLGRAETYKLLENSRLSANTLLTSKLLDNAPPSPH